MREIDEETGLHLATPPEPLFKLQACPETGNEFVWVYRCLANGPLILNSLEIEAADWFMPAELERWLAAYPENFTPGFRLIWARAVAHPRP
ncbi:MAG: NUDIX domain-containing protein [Gammaproteobacteria bacterium]